MTSSTTKQLRGDVFIYITTYYHPGISADMLSIAKMGNSIVCRIQKTYLKLP